MNTTRKIAVYLTLEDWEIAMIALFAASQANKAVAEKMAQNPHKPEAIAKMLAESEALRKIAQIIGATIRGENV